MKGGTATVDWAVLLGPLVHPTKILIVEAMIWIDRPVSAVQLEKVFGGEPNIGLVSYHLTTLADHGIVRRVKKRRVRGAWESFYRLAPTSCRGGSVAR